MKKLALFLLGSLLATTTLADTRTGLDPDVLPGPLVFHEVDRTSAELGQLLFFDPILSGNLEVSCATCHSPAFGSSDGLSLGLGDGAHGAGLDRLGDPLNRPKQRIPRNSPALFNLGAVGVQNLFHDGRLAIDPNGNHGFRTPAGVAMLPGVKNIIGAQSMLPVLSHDEMAGHDTENQIAVFVEGSTPEGRRNAWATLAKRVQSIPDYRQRFADLLGSNRDITYADIANSISDFIAHEFRADNSDFDMYLRGEATLRPTEMLGMQLFYGKAGCSDCHSGPLMTDQNFYAIAMPQIGPGKGHLGVDYIDLGRGEITKNPEDNYKFRVPSLRNVALTAPYGHSGAYSTLEGIVRHHLDPEAALLRYNPSRASLPHLQGADDTAALHDPVEMAAILQANELEPVDLTDAEVGAIVAFLNCLTDPVSYTGRLGRPDQVPSGLVAR